VGVPHSPPLLGVIAGTPEGDNVMGASHPSLIPVLGFALLALGLPGVTLLASGCADSDQPTRVGPPVPDRSSPQAVLASLREAYLNREIPDYESLLAVDFEFYFSEEDVQIAEKFTREEDLQAHGWMFQCESVEYVSLEFTMGELTLDPTKPDPARPGGFLWTITITNVDVTVRCHNDQGQPITYRHDDGADQFWFRQEERLEPGTDEPIWLIVGWKELTGLSPDGQSDAGGNGPPASPTWGQIKSVFAGGDCP
jgi:hypothetical protein